MITRLFYSLTAVLFLLISCQSGTPAADSKDAKATVMAPPDAAANTPAEAIPASSGSTAAPAVDSPMKPDTIKVIGKFIGCSPLPTKLKIAQHDELHAPWKDVSVNELGEFTYPIYLTEPRRIAMKTEKRTSYDFLATTTEKTYKIEINCANGQERIELKDSRENVPYRLFVNVNKKFREDLDAAAKGSAPFEQLKTIISDYHKTLDGIAADYPGTFTATFFCPAEKLPPGSLASLDALRKNFLNREVFANPYLYNDFLGQRILNNYLAIYDRNADQYDVINAMMTIGAKNPAAAKRLQQITYNVFYNRHEEQLIIAYIKWAGANPGLMQNAQVKGSLQRLEGVVPGNQIIDVQLKEPGGQIMKLSETVASAGKLVLLVFYSPTCDHCQHEIPQLKPLWEQYKSKGLKIYTVGFDSTEPEWHNFIGTKASTEWVNTFEYNSGTTSGYDYKYVVNYTPTYVFISPQGKIIKRFPTFEDVKRDLPELMK